MRVANPGVAAVLSFVIPGAGQLYNGQLPKGFGLMVGYAFSFLIGFVGLETLPRLTFAGFLPTIGIWAWGVLDALVSAERMMRS